MAVAKKRIQTTSQRRNFPFDFFLSRHFFWWCAHCGRVGSLWENRQCLICYDMNTQLDHRVQILQSAVRCQAALRGSSSGSQLVTHHIKITGESEAFFLSNQLTLQEMAARTSKTNLQSPQQSLSLFLVFSVLKRTRAWENRFYFHCAFLVAFYELEIHLFKNQFSWQAKKNIWLLVKSFQLRIIGADMLPRNSSGWTFFAARSLRPGAEARSVSDRRGRKQR